MRAEDIKNELERISRLAASVEPGLAYRLEETMRWIKDKKPGLLTSKKFLMDFLVELIRDARVWLDLKSLDSEERKMALEQFAPPERYWYGFLFPRWFNEADPKISIWKQKIMAGEFTQEDETLLEILLYHLGRNGGSGLRRYIMDLSMATDMAVSGNSGIPLCVQITTVSDELSMDKKQAWEMTLRYWGIERSLFLSFNPGKQPDILLTLADEIYRQSDELPQACYNECSLG